jgi:hypothetical protein
VLWFGGWVQDPVDASDNCGRSVDAETTARFRRECIRAYNLLSAAAAPAAPVSAEAFTAAFRAVCAPFPVPPTATPVQTTAQQQQLNQKILALRAMF